MSRQWDDVYAEVSEILVQEFGSSPESVTPEARLMQDQYLRGDDATDFLGILMSKYDIDFQNMNFDRYFHGEYYGLRDMYYALMKKDDPRKEPLTVKHIVDVIVKGEWFDPA